MGNRKKRPVPQAPTRIFTPVRLDIAVTVIAIVAFFAVLASVQMARAPAQKAYAQMYKNLESKGPDYAAVLDFYLACEASNSGLKYRGPDCMKETEDWAKRGTFTTPFSIIARDIREGEAKAYLAGKS
jgi:hypothetical protein